MEKEGLQEAVQEINGIKRLAELGALKLSLLFKDRISELSKAPFSYLLLPDVTEEEIAEAEYSGLLDRDNERDEIKERLFRLTAHCSSDVALTLLELVMLRTIEPAAAELLELVSPGNGNGVTLITAARAALYTGTLDEAMEPMKRASESASFLLSSEEGEDKAFFNRRYYADSYLLSFLSGEPAMEELEAEFMENWNPQIAPEPIYGMLDELDRLTETMERLMEKLPDLNFSILIEGERESGRYTAIKEVSSRLGLPLLAVDFSFLLSSKDPRDLIRLIVRNAALEGRALCIRNIIKHEDTHFILDRLTVKYRRHSVLPLILLMEPDVKLIPTLKERHISLKIPRSDKATLDLWKGFLPGETKELAESLSSKMNLTAGQIKRVAEAAETLIMAGETVDEHRICRLCYEVLDDGRYENVKWVEPGFTLKDLKIDRRNLEILNDICNQVEHRRKVYDGWGLKSRYAYGRCVSVILAGPPGTGKTMTVHALASRLGLELYKVDLSQVVDKYVGETEKRLEEVFDRAEKSNMILFFDEADSVMGKRGEVKAANDRYANTEVSFILQRLEEYDGIVLLSTNNIQNIDHAFMRRIRYVLNYELPDCKTREEIWRSAFGDRAPLSKDIDFGFLSEKFELSGGDIKNIVLNAVFCAAAEDAEVSMRHIMRAVFRESTKTKRISFNGDYGEYAYLMHD